MSEQGADPVVAAILEFSWDNYGLDEVSDTRSDDWAHDLAKAIRTALADETAGA